MADGAGPASSSTLSRPTSSVKNWTRWHWRPSPMGSIGQCGLQNGQSGSQTGLALVGWCRHPVVEAGPQGRELERLPATGMPEPCGARGPTAGLGAEIHLGLGVTITMERRWQGPWSSEFLGPPVLWTAGADWALSEHRSAFPALTSVGSFWERGKQQFRGWLRLYDAGASNLQAQRRFGSSCFG